ncbi:MAG: hypothetical protein WCK78_04135 [Paludibacter sp.]
MKAIVVKNNDFQTIGFEVVSNAKTLFSWGISTALKSNFQKEVDTTVWMPQIFDLVKLEGILQEQREFCREFFNVAEKNKLLKEGKGVDLGDYKMRIEITERKIENIIKNII